jgi:epoxyqueuosine reductase
MQFVMEASMSKSKELTEYIRKKALSSGALLVGFTKIRLTEPVIVFAYPFTEQWFLRKPLVVARMLDRAHAVSTQVMDISTKILNSEGYPVRCKSILSVYGDFRPLAVAAGLGNWGRNGIIVNKEYGAGLLFSAIFTNAPLDPTLEKPVTEPHCLSCGDCIRACPGQAFTSHGFLVRNCLPYCLRGCANCIKACKKWAGSGK